MRVTVPAVLALVLAAPLVAGQPASAATPTTPSATNTITPGDNIVSDRHTVTLITGDRISVGKDAAGQPTAAVLSKVAGTASINIVGNKKGVFALPSTALPLLAAHKVDPELFDVTKLVADGYDDENSANLPVIATYAKPANNSAAPAARTAPAYSSAVRQLPSVSGAALQITKASITQFWQNLAGQANPGQVNPDLANPASQPKAMSPNAISLGSGVDKLWLDDKAHASLDVSVPSIGAPQAWAEGLDGAGVKIAVLDTGIDANHPDFAGRIVAQQNFTASPSMFDKFGHGTHVASIAAGSGAADNGKYVGVAPKASLLIGKVLDDTGAGSDSEIIAGMQWAAAQGAKVVNMSLGEDTNFNDPTNPLNVAVDQISASSGTLFVIAASNDGYYGNYTVTTPGSADSALTVGATDAADPQVADFSSRGPRANDYAIKPEITGPGVGITAARAAGNTLGDVVDQYYQTLSGTSMATPHVAGSAALLAEKHPDWTGQQLKAALVDYAAYDKTQPMFNQGGGRVWVPGAVNATVTTDANALNLGYFAWPQPASQTAAKQVTFTNSAATPVTLNLAVSGTRFDTLQTTAHKGDNTPAALTVSPATITVPAHGSAAATVTGNIGASPTGVFQGRLTATDGGSITLGLPVSYTRDIEQYRLSVHAIDAQGNLPTQLPGLDGIWAFNLDTGDIWGGWLVNGDVGWPGWIGPGQLVKFPRGNYAVLDTGIFTWAAGAPSKSQLTVGAVPQLTLDKDTTVTFDARKGIPVAPVTPRRNATASAETAWFYRKTAAGWFTSEVGWGAEADVYPAIYEIPSSGQVTEGQFTYVTKTAMAQPLLQVTANGHTAVPVTTMTENVRYTGTYRGNLVDVGFGNPSDLAGRNLKGAVVLLHPTIFSDPTKPPAGADVASHLQLLQQAGVALALVVDSTQNYWTAGYLWMAKLPTVAVDESAGNALASEIAKHPVPITAIGSMSSPYAYYTTDGPRGDIPAQRQVVSNDQFARVDARYYQGPGGLGYACRNPHFIEPGYPYSFGGYNSMCTTVTFPTERTEYVQANTAHWQHTVSVNTADRSGNEEFAEREGVLKAGQRLTETPFQSPLLPCAEPLDAPLLPGEPTYAVQREGNVILVELANLCGANLDSWIYANYSDRPQTALYQDGKLLGKNANYFGSDSAGHSFELVDTVNRNAAGASGVSTQSTTDWTFHSAHTTGVSALPLAQIGFDLPIDLNNNAYNGHRQVIRLRPGHQNGVTNIPFTALSLSYSTDDGKTWQSVPVRGTDDGDGAGYQATVRPGIDSGHVSLKVAGTDANGNTVTETVIRAYGVTADDWSGNLHGAN